MNFTSEILIMLFGVFCSIGGAYLTVKVTIARMQKDIEHIEADIEEIKADRKQISEHLYKQTAYYHTIKNDITWIKEKMVNG